MHTEDQRFILIRDSAYKLGLSKSVVDLAMDRGWPADQAAARLMAFSAESTRDGARRRNRAARWERLKRAAGRVLLDVDEEAVERFVDGENNLSLEDLASKGRLNRRLGQRPATGAPRRRGLPEGVPQTFTRPAL